MASERTKSASLKQRAATEMEEYLVVALFLFALLGALATYTRLLIAEVHLHWGYAAIEALVLAKIILVGELLHLGGRYRDKPLVVIALYKSQIFAVLVFVFKLIEHVIRALVKGESPVAELARLFAQPAEIAAYLLVLLVVFVPFFSLQEAGRLLGEERFLNVLLKRPKAGSASQ
jgi:hypothetical protein